MSATLHLLLSVKIRYWVASKGKIGQTLQTAVGAVTGNAQAPGELRTITPKEVSR